jgi:hypothetical protein
MKRQTGNLSTQKLFSLMLSGLKKIPGGEARDFQYSFTSA